MGRASRGKRERKAPTRQEANGPGPTQAVTDAIGWVAANPALAAKRIAELERAMETKVHLELVVGG